VDKKVKNTVFHKNAYFSKVFFLAPETDFFFLQKSVTIECANVYLSTCKTEHMFWDIFDKN